MCSCLGFRLRQQLSTKNCQLQLNSGGLEAMFQLEYRQWVWYQNLHRIWILIVPDHLGEIPRKMVSLNHWCLAQIYKIRSKAHFLGEPNQRNSDQKSQKSQKCRKPSLKTTIVDFGSNPTTYGLYTHPPKSIFFSKWYFYTVGRGIKIAEFSRFRQKSHFARGRKERHRG